MANKIESYITELLGLHHCVTVSQLGSFIYRDSQASANAITREIRPSVRTLFFNSAILEDDGILVNHIRQQEGLNYNQALTVVHDFVADIKNKLEEKRNLSFGALGNFFLNQEQQIFFLPSNTLNFSKDTFGLPMMRLDELMAPKENVIQPVVEKPAKVQEIVLETLTEEFEEAEVVHIEEPKVRKMHWLFRAAAIFAILTLAGTGTWFGMQYVKSQQKGTQQASVLPIQTLTEKEIQDVAPAAQEIAAVAEETVSTSAEPSLQSIPSIEAYMETMKAEKGLFYVLGGMYMDESLAAAECKRWIAAGHAASHIKPENSSLSKVVLGRFNTEQEASEFANRLPLLTGSNISVRQAVIIK
ncbi:MAG: hypothetical protein ACK5DE_11405 [Bacteroidota bacterium]|jgi:hypothetical protein